MKYIIFAIPYDQDGRIAEYPEVVTTSGTSLGSVDSVAPGDKTQVLVFNDIEDAKAAARAILPPNIGDGNSLLYYHSCEYAVFAVSDHTDFTSATAGELWEMGCEVYSVIKRAR